MPDNCVGEVVLDGDFGFKSVSAAPVAKTGSAVFLICCALAFVGRLASHNLSLGFAVFHDRLPGPFLP